MRGRAGVVAVFFGLCAAGLAAGAIHAGPTAPPTTTADTTTEPSTDATTTTSSVETTTPAATTTAAPPLVRTVAAPGRPPRARGFVAGFALAEPGRPQVV